MNLNSFSVSDKMGIHDAVPMPDKIIRKTEVIIGTDAYTDTNGVTQFGEVLFHGHNMVVYGGSLFTLQKIFGLPADDRNNNPLNSGYLDSVYGMSRDPKFESDSEFDDTSICLFGLGTCGAGDSLTDVYKVNYSDNNLGEEIQTGTDEGMDLTRKTLLPFKRVPSTNNLLKNGDENKYWFKRSGVTIGNDTKDEYYLKTIESKEILVYDAAGNKIENEADLKGATDAVDTFVELKLVIDSVDDDGDLKTFFRDSGHIELSRFNSIGLFTATRVPIAEDADGTIITDYRNVRLYSKLNIPNELLVGSKELTIIYRIFAS